MADFDAIYEEDEDERFIEETIAVPVPDPIVVRGAGNVTVYVRFVICSVISSTSNTDFMASQSLFWFVRAKVHIHIPKST